jgi:acyl phosphate:glycerol-3-phosphate acyltransferase
MEMGNWVLWLIVVAGYLVGSLSFAVIVSKAMGLSDPRTFGSKNPGATNVLRSGSKKAAVITLVLDALKGFLPVAAVMVYGRALGFEPGTSGHLAFAGMVGMAAFFGHLFPVFFGFKGGKGVATAAGVIFGIHWALGLMVLASWALIAYFTRYSSLAAMVAALFAPLAYMMGDRLVWYVSRPVLLVLVVMAIALIVKHRDNINRLLAGKESKLSFGAAAKKQKAPR